MNRTRLVLENVETAPRVKLFRLLGVDWVAAPTAWLMPIIFTMLGIIIALVAQSDRTLSSRLLIGVIYGAIILVVYLSHAVGHTLSARWAGAPMKENMITALRTVNLYYDEDEGKIPSRVHLSRAIGGIAINLVMGIIGLIAWLVIDSHFILVFAVSNLLLGLGSFIPYPSIDGEVIFRELRRGR